MNKRKFYKHQKRNKKWRVYFDTDPPRWDPDALKKMKGEKMDVETRIEMLEQRIQHEEGHRIDLAERHAAQINKLHNRTNTLEDNQYSTYLKPIIENLKETVKTMAAEWDLQKRRTTIKTPMIAVPSNCGLCSHKWTCVKATTKNSEDCKKTIWEAAKC